MGETKEMTGGEALARMLVAHEIGPMFGMGGFQLLPFYDAARRLGIDHNLVNDERCGVFAADAYAKVTGRVGVCDATLGPGAINLLTGMVEALNAGTPMVLIAGDSHRDHSWKNMTQESRQMEILRPAAKELIRIESIQRIPELVRRAFSVATRGRPGPVVLDIPEDIAHGRHAFESSDLTADPSCRCAPSLRSRPCAESLQAAAALLRDAERPLVLAGGGIHLSGAAQALTALAEAQSLPVAHTMTGKGAIACTHPLSAGLFGRYDRIANELIAHADCLLVAGCKLGEIATRRFTLIPDGVPLIHLDIVADLAGANCDTIYAQTWNPTWGEYNTGSQGHVMMTFENGTRAIYEGAKTNACGFNGWAHEYVRAECENETLIMDNRRIERYPYQPRQYNREGQGEEVQLMKQAKWRNEWLIAQFLDWMDGGPPMETNVEANLQSVALIFAAIESSHTGQPVKVQEFLRQAQEEEERTHAA